MSKNIEVVYYGTEPEWKAKFSSDSERQCAYDKALTWYNYMSDETDHKKWFIDYLKLKHSSNKSLISYVSGLSTTKIDYGKISDPDLKYGFNPGILARLVLLDAPVPEYDLKTLEKCVDYFNLSVPKEQPIKEIVESSSMFDNIQEKTTEKINTTIGILEKMGDDIFLNKPKNKIQFSTNTMFENAVKESAEGKKKSKKQEITTENIKTCKDILYERNIKPNQVNRINDWFSNQSNTIREDIKKKKKEWGNSFDKSNYVSLLKFYEQIIEDCKGYLSSVKSEFARKPRKKKSKSPIELVKKVKHKSTDETYKISSLSPSKIIGADKVLLFNTKYRKATLLQSASPTGLSVKGTTIINFDEKSSYSKKLRKPEKFIKDVKDKGIRAVKNTLDEIKSKSYEAKGRINEDTIILGVY